MPYEQIRALQAIEDASNLDELLQAILEAEDLGLDPDIADLKVFGGDDPQTEEVWSWDETRLLVSAGGEFIITERQDWSQPSLPNGEGVNFPPLKRIGCAGGMLFPPKLNGVHYGGSRKRPGR